MKKKIKDEEQSAMWARQAKMYLFSIEWNNMQSIVLNVNAALEEIIKIDNYNNRKNVMRK